MKKILISITVMIVCFSVFMTSTFAENSILDIEMYPVNQLMKGYIDMNNGVTLNNVENTTITFRWNEYTSPTGGGGGYGAGLQCAYWVDSGCQRWVFAAGSGSNMWASNGGGSGAFVTSNTYDLPKYKFSNTYNPITSFDNRLSTMMSKDEWTYFSFMVDRQVWGYERPDFVKFITVAGNPVEVEVYYATMLGTSSLLTYRVKLIDDSNRYVAISFSELVRGYSVMPLYLGYGGVSIEMSSITNIPSAQDQQNESLNNIDNNTKEISNSIKDSNVSEANNQANEVINSIRPTEYGGVTGVITAPLNMINRMLDSNCIPLNLPFGFVEGSLTLPCPVEYYEKIGPLFEIYQVVIGGLISYGVLANFFFLFKDMRDPDKDRVDVAEL